MAVPDDSQLLDTPYDRKFVRRVVRHFSRSRGWIMERRMIEQHVTACLLDPNGLLKTMLRHYDAGMQKHRQARRLCGYATICVLGVGVGVHYWLGVAR